MAVTLGSEVKTLSKHSAVYGLTNVLNRAVAFILLPLYTHYLSPADYGVMDLIYFTSTFIGMIIGVGIDQAISRFYFDSEDQSERNLVVSSAYIGFGVSSAFFIILFILGSRLISSLVFDTEQYTKLIIVSLMSLGFDIYISAGFTYLRVRQRSVNLMIVAIIRLTGQLSLNILFIAYYEMGVMGMLLSTLIINVGLAAYFIFSVMREVGFRFSMARVKEMAKFGLPLIPSNIMGYIVNVSDRYFLNHFHGLSETGLYSLGYRFGVLINTFVTSPFGQIWVPRRFENYTKPDSEFIFGRIFTYFCLCSFGIGLVISVVVKEIIQLMSDQAFWSAYQVVPVLVLTYIVASFQMHFDIGILYKKKTTTIMAINIATAIVNLLLNYLLIIPYGMWGAACSVLFSFGFKMFFLYRASNAIKKIHVEWKRLLKIVAVAFALYWPLQMIDTGWAILNVIVKTIGCLGFPVILYIMRFFEPEEITRVKEITGNYYTKLRDHSLTSHFRRKR